MKKVFFSLLVLMAFTLSAQDTYWTHYNVVVAPQNEEMVYKIMDDYFTANKTEGVTVTLYENHFRDHGNNFTHSIGFAGTLDAMGNIYGADKGAAWNLLLVQLNQHIEKGYAARMGTVKMSNGDAEQDYPIQKYFIVHADDGGTWDAAFSTYITGNRPAGTLNMMGNFTSGVSSDRENRWVINGFQDFKSAIGGANMLRTDAEKAANETAWKTFLDTNGESHLVRSGLRIRLGQW